MNIFFATSNKGKINNATEALAHFGIKVKQYNFDFIESRSEDPAKIALEKAKQVFHVIRQPVIVEDSGFFIEALGGFPMTHIKFSLQTLGINAILKALRNEKNRKAYWKMTVAYVSAVNKCKTFTFIEKGELTQEPRPINRTLMSDYWRIYIPKMIKNNTLALSEMEEESLKQWKDYYAQNNHFMKFGQWIGRGFAKKK